MTLTLTAEAICETGAGRGFSDSVLVLDNDGNVVGRKDVFAGWTLIEEIPVRWSVDGGAGLYRLEIDDETRDGFGPYEGVTGTASVSCAPIPGEVFYEDYDQERWHRADPGVDSGLKTIRATVTDVTGATAEASVEIYVILAVEGSGNELPDGTWEPYRFKAGRTYRVKGFLMTFPADAEAGSVESVHGGEDSFSIHFHVSGYRGLIYIGRNSGRELSREVQEFPTPGVTGAARPVAQAELNARMDALIESVGEPPAGLD